MRFLFIHQNFPGQFVHLAPKLVERGHEVHAIAMRKDFSGLWSGVRVHQVKPIKGSTPGVHAWVVDFETKVIRAESVFRAALKLRQSGLEPEVIIAHPGWGESLFLKDVWPKAKLGIYCEFNYAESGLDVGFDSEFSVTDEGDPCRLRLKNLNNVMHFDLAHAAISPTRFQAGTFPMPFRRKIRVLHDGIDTQRIRPNPDARFTLPDGTVVGRDDEVVTFANRNLEPYRGYHIFMRALPNLLAERPNAKVIIVGGHGTSYGKAPGNQNTWKQIFIDEVRPKISDEDWARVFFLPNLDREQFLLFLQVSRVHVYLTYPFVAGWSLLEALSAGCAVVGSDTEPVQEFIRHRHTGLLTSFFDTQELVQSIAHLLEDERLRNRLGQEARKKMQSYFDLHSVCLPKLVRWAEGLGSKRSNRRAVAIQANRTENLP
ncbi:MAG: glycosyltransferase [Betaproteobacteria bacterium]|nr:glycosyltransferase [Betaproteobacteria bacterium]